MLSYIINLPNLADEEERILQIKALDLYARLIHRKGDVFRIDDIHRRYYTSPTEVRNRD